MLGALVGLGAGLLIYEHNGAQVVMIPLQTGVEGLSESQRGNLNERPLVLRIGWIVEERPGGTGVRQKLSIAITSVITVEILRRDKPNIRQ